MTPALELCPHRDELVVTRPRQRGERVGNLLGSRIQWPPVPAPARAHGDPRLRGALTDPDDVGHPARVRDPEGAHEEPGPVFPNQTPEAPPGSGHRWAPPSVPGARPWRAPWGGSSRRGRAAAPEAPPGPAARLLSAAASGGRPAAPRTSYWGPPRRRPPSPAAAHGPPAREAPGLRSGSFRTRLRLASARLARGLPPAPAAGRWRAGCTRLRPLLLQPPRMLSPGLAQSPGVELHARTLSLPAPSPAPCLPPPAPPAARAPSAHSPAHTHFTLTPAEAYTGWGNCGPLSFKGPACQEPPSREWRWTSEPRGDQRAGPGSNGPRAS